MRKYFNCLIIALGLLFFEISAKNGLTFLPGPDRFGDQLMAYIRGKWIARIKNIPFFIPENPTWQGLALEIHEPIINSESTTVFTLHKSIKKSREIKITKDTSTLFITDFNVAISGIRSFDDFYFTLKKDLTFCQEIKKMIAATWPIQLLDLPQDRTTIAVHVRKGGGFDAPLRSENNDQNDPQKTIYADKIWPTKFPPDDYYINSLNEIMSAHPNKSYYIHIFTDHSDPKTLAKKFKKSLINHANVSFGCRIKNNSYRKNIIDDLINMARFDILIRPQSSFSRVAQLIGDHEIIISPLKARWKNDKLIVTKISRVKKYEVH